MNEFEIGFQNIQQRVGQEIAEPAESANVNRYIQGLEYQDAAEIASRAAEFLKQNHPNVEALVKDLGGERVVAHTAAAFILTCFEKIYKG